MTKTKDEILMVALGAKQFSSLEKWQREQLYYAMDEWATQHKTAQLQQHGVVRGGDLKHYPVQAAANQNTYTVINTTGATPTGLLPAEGADLTVCDGIRG